MSKAKILLAACVWLCLLTAGVLLYRLWIVPSNERQAEQDEQAKIDSTSGNSNYQHRLKIGLDGFSGYAILRSASMAQELRSRGIKMDVVDDGADYAKRLSALASGELQMAAFPIDALLKASERTQGLPATIVAIIDETRGADALLAYKRKYPNIDALNSVDTKFVLVGDSPSETLVRVLMHSFQLDAVSNASLDLVAGEPQLLQRYRLSTPGGNEVFATWQPVVSELLKNPEMHVLVDSSKQSGYIVDTLVVSRDFLVKNEPVVREVLESYFSALFSAREPDDFLKLIQADASAGGASLSAEQAQSLVDGIVWKNTQENLAHFGLRSASVTHVEDMIDRIKRVLLETGGLNRDPTGGASSNLFYERPLQDLQTANFFPGGGPESVREDVQAQQLSDREWDRLDTVGTAQVPPLIYARGTARLTDSSKAKLDDLVANLQSWPMYYVMIRGNASSQGNLDANRKLAKQRADAALEYLLSRGVPAAKLRTMDGELSGQMSVTFTVGQMAF